MWYNKQMNTNKKPSLFKQAMGGVIGATLAVGLYYGYEYGAPQLNAFLVTPDRFPNFFAEQEANIVSNTLPQDRVERINSTVRKALNNPEAQMQIQQQEKIEELHNGAPEPGYKPYIPPVYEPPRAQVVRERTQLPPLPPERIVSEEITTTVTETITHAPALPDSGFPLALFAFGTGGAIIGARRKRQ